MIVAVALFLELGSSGLLIKPCEPGSLELEQNLVFRELFVVVLCV